MLYLLPYRHIFASLPPSFLPCVTVPCLTQLYTYLPSPCSTACPAFLHGPRLNQHWPRVSEGIDNYLTFVSPLGLSVSSTIPLASLPFPPFSSTLTLSHILFHSIFVPSLSICLLTRSCVPFILSPPFLVLPSLVFCIWYLLIAYVFCSLTLSQ